MALKRKISIRKILQVFLTLVVTSCCITAILSASKIENNKTLKTIAVHYNNCKKYHSVEEKDIMKLAIESRNIDVWHTPVSRLDIRTMEQLIMANPWIAAAQVYIDNERVLHMYVTQRIPVVRIFQKDGNSFYLDTTMSAIPLSDNYVYYTGVVTNVPELKNDSASQLLKKDIISLVRTIQADSFWSAQVSQIIVDSAGMYELVPVLGDHRILFGGISDAKEKLDKLFVFYKKVLNRIGWDKYETLDIRFNGQIVASPSLPYTGPVDKVVTGMNWINSIITSESMNDSVRTVAAKDKPAPVKAANVADKPAVKAGVPQKNAAGAAAKKTVKAPVKAAPKKNAAKDVKKNTAKDTKKNAKDDKKKKPKYVYPDKKVH